MVNYVFMMLVVNLQFMMCRTYYFDVNIVVERLRNVYKNYTYKGDAVCDILKLDSTDLSCQQLVSNMFNFIKDIRGNQYKKINKLQ